MRGPSSGLWPRETEGQGAVTAGTHGLGSPGPGPPDRWPRPSHLCAWRGVARPVGAGPGPFLLRRPLQTHGLSGRGAPRPASPKASARVPFLCAWPGCLLLTHVAAQCQGARTLVDRGTGQASPTVQAGPALCAEDLLGPLLSQCPLSSETCGSVCLRKGSRVPPRLAGSAMGSRGLD